MWKSGVEKFRQFCTGKRKVYVVRWNNIQYNVVRYTSHGGNMAFRDAVECAKHIKDEVDRFIADVPEGFWKRIAPWSTVDSLTSWITQDTLSRCRYILVCENSMEIPCGLTLETYDI
jgi:hypothetical protein